MRNRSTFHLWCLLPVLLLGSTAPAQTPPPAVTPPAAIAPERSNSNRLPPAYPTPYAPATVEEIRAVLDRVLGYLETASPVKVRDARTREPVTDLTHLPDEVIFDREEFHLTSYEWGVTYAGMLRAAEVTGDVRFQNYAAGRLAAIATVAAHLRPQTGPGPAAEPREQRRAALRNVIHPQSLDDSGSMAAAMLKASRAGLAATSLRPWIDNYLDWITRRQFRLPDGTLARSEPMPNTLWLDDLYMSVPALAQMGAFTGEEKYFNDAVKQVQQFSSRMFLRERGLYVHGWVQEMTPHPAFHWARANGWAVMALAELLETLPAEHPGRSAVLGFYRAHVHGLTEVQGSTGLWHQLLDRPDSYLETSASAMFTWAIARGINRGWLDPLAYGPMVSLAWNAVAQRVNARGQVEGTCVGTGMGFDPMFYYYRPVSTAAAHGYGPVLLAGAEMIALRQGRGAALRLDGAVHLPPAPEKP